MAWHGRTGKKTKTKQKSKNLLDLTDLHNHLISMQVNIAQELRVRDEFITSVSSMFVGNEVIVVNRLRSYELEQSRASS